MGGIGYLIDIKNKKLKYQTDEHPLILSAIRTTSPNYFVAGTFYNIYIFDSDKLIKELSPEFMIDGIYFKTQIAEKAIGDLATAENQYENNIDFEIDLVTFKLKLFEKPNLVKRLINKWKKK